MQLTHEANQLMDAFASSDVLISIATWRAASSLQTTAPPAVLFLDS